MGEGRAFVGEVGVVLVGELGCAVVVVNEGCWPMFLQAGETLGAEGEVDEIRAELVVLADGRVRGAPGVGSGRRAVVGFGGAICPPCG